MTPAQRERQERLAAFRKAHPELNPQASDQTVAALMYLETFSGASAPVTREEDSVTDTKRRMEACAVICDREVTEWAKHAGVCTGDGSPEDFWWEVFMGLLDRMCPRARR